MNHLFEIVEIQDATTQSVCRVLSKALVSPHFTLEQQRFFLSGCCDALEKLCDRLKLEDWSEDEEQIYLPIFEAYWHLAQALKSKPVCRRSVEAALRLLDDESVPIAGTPAPVDRSAMAFAH